MKEYSLIIDGGTTNTRFTLLDRNTVISRTICKVGASSADSSGANEQLKKAVKDKIAALKEQFDCAITDIYASGMITSNAGLFELAHIEAPASLKALYRGIRTISMSEICEDGVFHFIPGIRFHNQPGIGIDMMRGEEVEIFGALKQEDEAKALLFLHFGSHNKLIFYRDENIQNSITTIGGELLWAILNHTILKSSAGELPEAFDLDEEYVKAGFKETEKNNISRSMFQGRIRQVVGKAGKEQVLSYICGAVMYTDLQAFIPLLEQQADKCILYGREAFIQTFLICLPLLEFKIPRFKIEIIPYEESEWLSFKGVQKIRRYMQDK